MVVDVPVTARINDHAAFYAVGGRRIVVCEPATHAYGHTLVELMHGLGLARREEADLVFMHDGSAVNPALFDIELDGLEIFRDGAAAAVARTAFRLGRRRPDIDAVRQELAAEIKWAIRDRRFRSIVRRRLSADQARLVSAVARNNDTRHSYFRRDLLVENFRARQSAVAVTRARELIAALGLEPDSPVVCLHVREAGFKRGRDQEAKGALRVDHVRNATIENYFPACDTLVEEGYTVVRIGDPSMKPIERRGYLDLAHLTHGRGLLELFVFFQADLHIVSESGPMVMCYLTDTPVLLVNATEVFSAYPLREDGHLMMKRVIDLEEDRELEPFELLDDRYIDNVRDVGRFRYEENSAEDILAALKESLALVRGERAESPRQAAFRDLATRAAVRQRGRSSYVRKWGPDGGFLGHGRLVDLQLGTGT